MRGLEWPNRRTRRNPVERRRWARLVMAAGEPQLASRSGRSAGENYSKCLGVGHPGAAGVAGTGVGWVKNRGPEGWMVDRVQDCRW